MLRTATLFSRTGASSPLLGTNTYPTALSAALGEEQVYHPGLHDLYPATVRVTRAALGVTSKLKFQGTTDMPDLLLIGVGAAQISLYALATGKSIKLLRGTTPGTTTSHVTSSGLTTITMSLDAVGRDVDTATDISNYLAANLAATFTAAVVGAGTGLMGATYQARDVPILARWVDIESTREDTSTTATEHTVDPGADATITLGFLVKTGGFQGIRCIATATAAPAATDSVLVVMGLPG